MSNIIQMETAQKTTELVREEISSNLYINEVLKKGFINYSALARDILPRILQKNKKANFSSVLIAIQRYYDETKVDKSFNHLGELLKDCEIIMKNKIFSLTLERNKQVVSMINKISQTINWDIGDIMFFVQGSGEIAVIIDKKNLYKFDALKSNIIEQKDNLAILSIRETGKKYSKEIPGILALLTSTLTKNHINIIDLDTTYRQMLFIIEDKDLTKAYESFDTLIKHYRGL